MINTLIYTYKKLNYDVYRKKINQKEWIIKSIESARKLNYNIELYTNDTEFSEGLDLDKVHFIDDDYKIWDSFKIWVLKYHPTNNYFLSDNDIIYHSNIEYDSTKSIILDAFEQNNWNSVYGRTLYQLKLLNILDNKIWDYRERNVMSVGILSILDNGLKKYYISEWERTYNLLQPHLHLFDVKYLTPVITQYLLTIILEYNDIKYQHLAQKKYYTHYSGYKKIEGTTII